MKMKSVEVEVSGETLLKLKRVAKLTKVSLNTVINVILALEVSKK